MSTPLLEPIRRARPLVHCITNPVTINDCANILLAAGASPTMAYHEEETAEIAARASALVFNLGHTTALTAMLRAGKAANELGIPIALDPVGVGASHFRLGLFRQLASELHLSVIRGNASEIRALAEGILAEGGVDAAAGDRLAGDALGTFEAFARKVASHMHCVVVVSGETDLVVSETDACRITGGCAEMSRITGSGCMLTSLTGAFLAVEPNPSLAAAAAVRVMNTAGERAKEKTDQEHGGTMTFRLHLIDEISLMA